MKTLLNRLSKCLRESNKRETIPLDAASNHKGNNHKTLLKTPQDHHQHPLQIPNPLPFLVMKKE